MISPQEQFENFNWHRYDASEEAEDRAREAHATALENATALELLEQYIECGAFGLLLSRQGIGLEFAEQWYDAARTAAEDVDHGA